MRKRQVFLNLLLVGTAIFLQGCFAAAVGAGAAGTVFYVKGDLEAVESQDINIVYAATKNAVEQLGLKVIKDTKDALSATVEARDAEDKKVTIKLKTTAENTTKLFVRVGFFGSETKSRLIYKKIQDNLK